MQEAETARRNTQSTIMIRLFQHPPSRQLIEQIDGKSVDRKSEQHSLTYLTDVYRPLYAFFANALGTVIG